MTPGGGPSKRGGGGCGQPVSAFDAREQVVAVEEDVGDVERAGRGVEREQDGSGEVGAVHLGREAGRDRLAAQVGGEEIFPLVRAAAVDAGGAQADAAAGERRPRPASLISP